MVSQTLAYVCRPLLIAALWVVPGCSESPVIADTDCVRISAAIDEQTRTSMSGSTASFITGDRIGVFETLTGRSNALYTNTAGTWRSNTPIYWYNATSNHTFYAYYPYHATSSGLKAGIPVLSTQTITTAPTAALDLLVASPAAQKRSANVAMTFTHAYALIQLNIRMGILQLLNPYYLNGITIQGGNTTGANRYGIVNITGTPPQVGYDFTAQAVTAATNNNLSYAQSFYSSISGISLTTTAITFYALVLPGTYANPVPGISFQITTLGILHTTLFSNFSNTTFQAGTKYVYNVSIGLLSRSQTPEVSVVPAKTVPLNDPTIEPPINQQILL